MIRGMPALNLELMYQASRQSVKGQADQISYWSRLLDRKNQTLTPNSDVIYLQPFYNSRDTGPILVEMIDPQCSICDGIELR